MAKIVISFNTDNAAFEDNGDGEVSAVLEQAEKIIASGNFEKPLRDTNGNKIGMVTME